MPNEQWKVEVAKGMIEIYLPGYNVLHDCCTIFHFMKYYPYLPNPKFNPKDSIGSIHFYCYCVDASQ